MVAYEKFRNPQTQAVYWKQGRTKDEVTLAIKLLQKDKAFYLIDCIESAEHRDGIIITNALPGLSWHQLEKR